MEKGKQLSLFGHDEQVFRARKKPTGGSQNPIVFNDYESYVAKFNTEGPKTTDDTYTPKDVYEAVLKYVGEIYDMTGKQVLRPFYPGGDYENAEYPENGVVIDNPPFSMFKRICKFYTDNNIPFFLFGPGMTIFCICDICTAVVINRSIIFHNGADVRINFATNLLGDICATTSVRLNDLIGECPSQNIKAGLPSRKYPAEIVSVSDMQSIARGSEDFAIPRAASKMVKKVGGVGLFGNHLLISTYFAKAKEKAKEKAFDVEVRLTAAEKMLVDRLGNAAYG